MAASALVWALLTACVHPLGAVNTVFFWVASVATRSVPAVLAAGSVGVAVAVAVLVTAPTCTLAIGAAVSAPARGGWAFCVATAAARSTTATNIRRRADGDMRRPCPDAGSLRPR